MPNPLAQSNLARTPAIAFPPSPLPGFRLLSQFRDLTEAQIRAGTTPLTVVPAVPGMVLVGIDCIMEIRLAGNTFSATPTWKVQYGTGTPRDITGNTSTGNTANQYFVKTPVFNAPTTAAGEHLDNRPLNWVGTAVITGGVGAVGRITIVYQMVPATL